MDLKFKLNLQNLCIIAVAESIWNQKDIADKAKKYFYSLKNQGKHKVWDWLTQEAIKQLNPQSLPEALYREVVYVVDILGKKKRDWFSYLKMRTIFRDVPNQELYENYFKEIHLTYYGTINEEKIITSWFHNPNCDLWKVYVMACCFCSEEVIKEIWTAVSKKFKSSNFKKLNNQYGWHLAAYWNRRFNNDLENFISDIKSDLGDKWEIYDEGDSIELNMFKLAVSKGYKLAAQKFWFEMQEVEKIQNLNENLEEILFTYGTKNYAAKNYRYEQNTEILIFLLCNSDNGASKLLIENTQFTKETYDKFLDNLASWPWIDLFNQFVYNIKGLLNEEIYQNLFLSLVCNYYGDSSLAKPIRQRKLYQLWRVLPHNYREPVGKYIVDNLFRAWDIANLKLIINDKALIHIRAELIKIGRSKLMECLEERNKKMMKEFVEEILVLQGVKETDQQSLKIVYQNIWKGEFHLADEYLNTVCNCSEEKDNFKKMIDEYVMCSLFLKRNQFEFADKFLKWKFYSELEVNDYKFNLFFDEFSKNCIYSFWNTLRENAEAAKIQSTNFLKFFADTFKGKAEYLMKLMITREVTKIDGRCPAFAKIKRNNFEVINDFLKWCSFSEYEIKEWKKRFFCDGELCRYLEGFMRKNENDTAEKFLRWVMDDYFYYSQRGKLLEKFVISDNGIRACKYFIGNTSASNRFTLSEAQLSHEEIIQKMKAFIKFWMRVPVNLDKLINSLEKWPERSSASSQKRKLENSESTDEYDQEISIYENDYDVFCDRDGLSIFLNLLIAFKKNGNEFVD